MEVVDFVVRELQSRLPLEVVDLVVNLKSNRLDFHVLRIICLVDFVVDLEVNLASRLASRLRSRALFIDREIQFLGTSFVFGEEMR
jgi:hypothetical protein